MMAGRVYLECQVQGASQERLDLLVMWVSKDCRAYLESLEPKVILGQRVPRGIQELLG